MPKRPRSTALSIIFCKMSDNIFDLVYADYDWQEHYFFSVPEGTTLEDFEKLCNRLIPQAGYRAALKKSSPKKEGWICWSDVVEGSQLLVVSGAVAVVGLVEECMVYLGQ